MIKKLSASFFLVMAASGCAMAQGGNAGTAPPAGLPRILFETDVGPNVRGFSVWNWKNDHYEGVWQSGAVAEMAVVSSDPSNLVFKRQDVLGATKGLTGTYTARWDSGHMSGGKLDWALNGISANWEWLGELVPEKDGLPVTMTQSKTNSVSNWFPVPLVAFSFAGYSPSPTTSFEYDIDYPVLNKPPIQPYETRDVTLICRSCPYTWPDLSIAAAIFADGTMLGDKHNLAVLLDNRKNLISIYRSIEGRLSELQSQHLALAEIVETLKREYYHANRNQPGWSISNERAITATLTSLNKGVRANVPAEVQIGKTLAEIGETCAALQPLLDLVHAGAR